jgi:predicted RNA-binding protein
MTKYWIAVASREHVKGGVKGGFAQVCHGKAGPLNRMAPNDWIIYYSPVEQFGSKIPCRKFTAIGKVKSEKPYQFRMSDDFIPWRVDVAFHSAKDIAIEPLIDKLKFIKDKKKWGFPFRAGCFSIPEEDFHLIASNMGINE